MIDLEERYREGDYLETKEGLLFHVKGLLHPSDRVVAFLRYIPDPSGNREKGGKKYRKIYPLEDRFEFLKENYPKYITYSETLEREIQAVPHEDIVKTYKPTEKIKEIRKKDSPSNIEKEILELSEKIIAKAKIKPEYLGVTGSVLVGLQTENSDIDLIGYGKENGWRIHTALKKLREEDEKIQPYDDENSLRIARFRWSGTGFPPRVLSDIEKNKALHGTIDSRDFFVRLVLDWNDIDESFNSFNYSFEGKSKIEGMILEDEFSIFTPNTYLIKKTRTLDGKSYDVNRIVSYRGRFTEQAEKGDEFQAYGRIEKVTQNKKEYHRMLLGRPEEYLLPLEKIRKPTK